MSKLTLSVDGQVVRRAKTWAAREGTSVSKLVERFLRDATGPDDLGATSLLQATPVLRRLRGCMQNADVDVHRRHLERKYR